MESQRASNPAVNSEIIVSAIFFINVGLDKILLDKIFLNHNFTLHFTAGSIRLRMPCAVKLHAFELGRCQTNAYVVEVPANTGQNTFSACWVVDPGESPEPLLNFLRDRG